MKRNCQCYDKIEHRKKIEEIMSKKENLYKLCKKTPQTEWSGGWNEKLIYKEENVRINKEI